MRITTTGPRRLAFQTESKVDFSLAVIVPLYRPVSSFEERMCLNSIDYISAEHSRFLVKPLELKAEVPGFEHVDFDLSHFLTVDTYSRLLLSDEFYSRFSDFDYLLIVQTDALVLGSSIDGFLDSPSDYLGAPWFVGEPNDRRLSRVGNGGFSLRRVAAFRDVLRSTQVPAMTVSNWVRLTRELPDIRHRSLPHRIRKSLSVLRSARVGIDEYCANYSLNEDHFWGDRARLFDPDFQVAEVGEALKFAFEENPRACFELAGRQLPFGCHGWQKHDRRYWTGIIGAEFRGLE